LGGDFEKVAESIGNSIKNRSKWSTKIKYVMPTGRSENTYRAQVPTFLTDGSIIYNSVVLDITRCQNERTTTPSFKIARLGSWEMDLLNQTNDKMYWSPVIWDILELDNNYNPSLTGGN
jgi:hypothetical protein